jgi:hypothetical protein
VLVNIVVGVIVGGICHAVVGGGIAPPIPILVLFGIVSVVVTFWLAIMFGGWPFTSMIKSPVGAGLAMLAAVYIINYLLFRLFFDFSFMAGAPWYQASLDPHGMFNGVNAQVFYVTALTFLFVMLHFDLWPFTSSPALMKQPCSRHRVDAASAGAGRYSVLHRREYDGHGSDDLPHIRADPVHLWNHRAAKYAPQFAICQVHQPLKGVLNCVAALVIGVFLARMYGALAPTVTGRS